MSAAALLHRIGRGDVRLGTPGVPPAPRLPTGLDAVDALLDGGLPRGRLSEVVGRRSAGRTALATAVAARATRAGETVAWVDPGDHLDPERCAAADACLARLLWIRPRTAVDALRAAEIALDAGGLGLVVLDLDPDVPRVSAGLWARLGRAAERTLGVVLVLAPAPTAGGSALALDVAARRVRWSRGPDRLALLDGIDVAVTVTRSRTGRAGRSAVARVAA